MGLNIFCVNVLVICAAVLQATASPKPGAPPVLDATANPEAYLIYAMSLEAGWKGHNDSLLVQQEIDAGVPSFLSCGPSFLSKQTGEWAEVARDFQQQNTGRFQPRSNKGDPVLSSTGKWRDWKAGIERRQVAVAWRTVPLDSLSPVLSPGRRQLPPGPLVRSRRGFETSGSCDFRGSPSNS
jgi:hypothetical protein